MQAAGEGSWEAVFIPKRRLPEPRGQLNMLLWPLCREARELLPEAAAQHLGHIDFF